MISNKYTINSTPALIAAAKESWRTIYLHVIGNGIVYLGDSTVTSSTGTPTEKGSVPFALTVPAGETVYAVVASGTEDLRVLSSSAA